MIKVILFDFARVILMPKQASYTGALNDLYATSARGNDYSVWNDFLLNEELLKFIKTSLQDYTCCIFTTGLVHKDPAILPQIQDLFTKMYSVLEINRSKKDPQSYKFIANDLGVDPKEILFIDDTESNIEAAAKAGLQTIHFQSNDQLFRELKEKVLF